MDSRTRRKRHIMTDWKREPFDKWNGLENETNNDRLEKGAIIKGWKRR